MSEHSRTPLIVGILALAWNALGLAALLGDALAGDDARAGMSAAQRALAEATPAWAIAGSFVAVLAGCAAAWALIRQRKWAVQACLISLAGLCVQNFWLFGLADIGPAYGQTPLILQGLVFLIATALWAYARLAAGRGDIA